MTPEIYLALIAGAVTVAGYLADRSRLMARIAVMTADIEEMRVNHEADIAELKATHKAAISELSTENKALREKVADLYERLAAANSKGIF